MKYIYFISQTSETICGYLTPAIKIASIVLLAIKVLVPIALIVIGLIKYLSAIADKSDKIDNSLRAFINNVIAAICVFLVITLIKVVVNIVTPKEKSACVDCLFDVSTCKNLEVKRPTPINSGGSNKPSKLKLPIESESKWNNENDMYRIYHVTVPEKATTNMPLVVFLRGTIDENKYSESVIRSEVINSSFHKQAQELYGKKLPFILMQPYSNSLSSFSEDGNKLSVISSLYTQINEVCNKYKCDKDRIIIVGFSLGGVGVWSMVNNYKGFFHKAVSISGACTEFNKKYGCLDINPSNFKNTPLRAYVGEDESGVILRGSNNSVDNSYGIVAKNNVDAINNAGGNAQFTIIRGAKHGTVQDDLYNKALFDWMLK